MNTAAGCCSVCGKKESPAQKLLQCSLCSSSKYLLCGKKCQRKDWRRHKKEECFVLRVEDGSPSDPCACGLCKGEDTDDKDAVSDFFNELHFIRGNNKAFKFINDVTSSSSNVMVNGVPTNLVQITLSEEELDRIAYPFPMLVYKGHTMLDKTKTFYAPDGKAFTVRQLATAIAKAEKENIDKLEMIGMMGGGWYFEGLRRNEYKEPHTFAGYWGTNMVTFRMGFNVVGIGFNPLTSRIAAMEHEVGEGGTPKECAQDQGSTMDIPFVE
eukprot:scaffold11241_cov148-Skeletonema_marinoi.AAC.4